MKKGTKIRQAMAALLLCGCGGMAFTQAATVKVSVTVVQPLPCTINGGRPIEVNFGDELMTTRIDGYRYRVPIDFRLPAPTPIKAPCACRYEAARPILVKGCSALIATV